VRLGALTLKGEKQKISHPIHFRLFTDRRTVYLIVQTQDKMRYWIAGLKKLNPELEIDVV
jgi:hypothetical protein